MLGATIQLTGTIHELRGARPFVGNRITIEDLHVIIPAENDLSLLPPLIDTRSSLPLEIARLSRHRINGTVLHGGERELEVDLGRDTIRVYAGEESHGFGAIETGSEIELTGVAILESGFWREGMPFPRISRAGGSFRIESASGRTYARFSIPV